LRNGKYFKLARPDGWDFYSGKTINYRESIGKTVTCPNQHNENPDIWNSHVELCTSTVLHASKNPNDCFVGAKIPCSAYVVYGKPVVATKEKCGFKEFKILEEIPDAMLDRLFGWKYSEVCNPLDPRKVTAPAITNVQIDLLRNWDSVRDSVWNSVWDSVWDSVWNSVWDSVRDSVWNSVWDSVRYSVRNSVRNSVRDSVRDSEAAYVGSLFPKIKKWKYIKDSKGIYPFQPCVDLLRQGFIPSYDQKTWQLHAGSDCKVVFEIEAEKLRGA